MSLFFGIVHFDGEPVSPSEIATVLESLTDFPREQYVYEIRQNVYFGSLANFNRPESPSEQVIRFLPELKTMFVSQGRLDNRKEIADLLGFPLKPETTDGELMSEAYSKWHETAPEKLLGDWSFAAFHLERGKLFLGRDHHGYSSLYYRVLKNTFVFSSVTEPILALFQERKMNRDLLLSNLVLGKVGKADASQTLYHGLSRLLPAHYLKADKDRLQTKRFWFPEQIQTTFGKAASDYPEELSAILSGAVQDRLHSHKPVASMLSGGLDSGTVTCLAAGLLNRKGETLACFSHVPLFPPSANLPSQRWGDEKPYIESVVSKCGNITPNYLQSPAISPCEGISETLRILREPIYGAANLYWLYDIYRHVGEGGYGTLLTGEHGNATISFAGLDYLLPWRCLRQAFGLRRTLRQKVLRPVGLVARSLGLLRQQKSARLEYLFINPQLAGDPELKEAASRNLGIPTNYSESRQLALDILMPGKNPRCHLGAAFAHRFGFEMSDPTADVRVVEYCLSIPNEIFFDECGKQKNLLRLMMRDKLPAQVLDAQGKGIQSADLGLRLKKHEAQTEDFLQTVIGCAAVAEFMDVAKLESDWKKIKSTRNNNYNAYQTGHFLRALMIGKFLSGFTE